MSFRDLRRAAEIDEQHPTASGAGEQELGRDGSTADSRRRFLTRAATGGAIAFGATVLPMSTLMSSAVAQTTSGSTAGSTAGSTPGSTPGSAPGTTAAKKKVEPKVEGADLMQVVFLQTIELAAVKAYGAALDTGKVESALAQTMRDFSSNHQQHADALALQAGSDALNIANPALTAELAPRIAAATDQTALVTILQGLEEGCAATYAAALGTLSGWEIAGIVSTILPVVSQQALVLSQKMQPDTETWAKSITTYIPNFQSETGAFTPSKYAAS